MKKNRFFILSLLVFLVFFSGCSMIPDDEGIINGSILENEILNNEEGIIDNEGGENEEGEYFEEGNLDDENTYFDFEIDEENMEVQFEIVE